MAKLTLSEIAASAIRRDQLHQAIGETFGSKLRRLARAARDNNPLINAPWTIPADWAQSTAYVRGAVVEANSNWYLCVGNGTSAASGTGPSTTTAATISDGTAVWIYYGAPTAPSADALAPTFSSTTSDPSATYPNIFRPITHPAAFRATGGYTRTYSTTGIDIVTFDRKATDPTCGGAAVSFITDAGAFALKFGPFLEQVRVVIDGRYYNISSSTVGASTTWFVFDFAGRKAVRRVTIEGPTGAFNLREVGVKSTDQVWSPPATDTVRVAAISDSIFAGSAYGPFLAGATLPGRIGKLLGWDDVWNMSIGGTGYISTGASSYYTYGQRIADALTRNPDLWLFMGSTNDIGNSAASITAAALSAFEAIRDGGSLAPIIVMGVLPINNAGVSGVETAVQDAVTQFADPLGKTFFIPLFGASPVPWITHGGNNSANTSSVNVGAYISSDNVHPSDLGTAYLADRAATTIRDQVLPEIA